MSVFHAAADWAPAPTTDTASFPLPSPESIVLTTSPLARPRLLSITSSRRLSSPATLIHHITARLDRMEVVVEPIIVDEGNRGKSDSCFLLLTPFVTARSFSPRTTAPRPSRPSPFDLSDFCSLSQDLPVVSPASHDFFSVTVSLFSGESVIKYRKRELCRQR